jgi:RNA polymerase sigma-70 factor (ECF subfamily)
MKDQIKNTESMEILVNKARTGDKDALTKLYRVFQGKIYRYVFFKCGNHADSEDITNEVFLRMIQSIANFQWKGIAFSSWLFRIASNLVIDYYRNKARRNTESIKERDYIGETNWEQISEFLDNRDLFKIIYEDTDDLSELQKEVVNLRFIGELSLKETAEAMSKNVNSVKAIQHAAIKKLKEKVKKNQKRNLLQQLTSD